MCVSLSKIDQSWGFAELHKRSESRESPDKKKNLSLLIFFEEVFFFFSLMVIFSNDFNDKVRLTTPVFQ